MTTQQSTDSYFDYFKPFFGDAAFTPLFVKNFYRGNDYSKLIVDPGELDKYPFLKALIYRDENAEKQNIFNKQFEQFLFYVGWYHANLLNKDDIKKQFFQWDYTVGHRVNIYCARAQSAALARRFLLALRVLIEKKHRCSCTTLSIFRLKNAQE